MLFKVEAYTILSQPAILTDKILSVSMATIFPVHFFWISFSKLGENLIKLTLLDRGDDNSG